MIAENLISVRRRIADASMRAGRPPEHIELVCVTKEASVDEIKEVIGQGVGIIGENRVQDAVAKHSQVGDSVTWHLVGHLQTNKAADALKIFSLIHSVDSVRLAKEIDRLAKKAGKVQDILVQVNTSGEATKFGMGIPEAIDIFKEIYLYPNINIRGLMTIAPEVDDPELARPPFRALRELRDRLNSMLDRQYPVLSMGMTDDFEVAIEEGSTMVRIGRAIFQ